MGKKRKKLTSSYAVAAWMLSVDTVVFDDASDCATNHHDLKVLREIAK